ncbi:hypothetical protein ABK040_012558 [Willaertia magna]
MTEEKLKDMLKEEIDKLLDKEWPELKFTNYPTPTNKHFHRTKIKNIEEIKKIKNYVLEKLGFIPVYIFLLKFGESDYIGPYRNLEKGILLLYLLLSGKSLNYFKNENIFPYSTLQQLTQQFYVDKYKDLNDWLDKKL